MCLQDIFIFFCWGEIQPHSHPKNSPLPYDSSLQSQLTFPASLLPACDRYPKTKRNKFIAVSLSLRAFEMLLHIASLNIHQETQINLFWQQALLLSEPHVLSGYYMKISSWYSRLGLSQLRWITRRVEVAIRGYNPHISTLELASLIRWQCII